MMTSEAALERPAREAAAAPRRREWSLEALHAQPVVVAAATVAYLAAPLPYKSRRRQARVLATAGDNGAELESKRTRGVVAK